MTVSDQIIQVMDALCDKFGMAIDWTNANVIPYATTLCTKFITYEICMSILSMVEALMFAIIIVVLVKKFYPTFKQGWEEDSRGFGIGWQVATIFAIVAIVFFAIGIICTIETATTNIVKCIAFPEMYIFEYIQGVLNAGG